MLGTAFVLGGPLQFDELRLETARASCPCGSSVTGARIVFGWMQQPLGRRGGVRARRRAPGLARRGEERAAGRALPATARPRLRRARLAGGRGGAAAGLGRAARAQSVRHRLLRARRRAVEVARLRPRPRRPRGSGDGLGRRAAGAPPRAARPDRLRRRDRDPAGRRARAAVDAVRRCPARRRRPRSAAPPSSWRAASSVCKDLERWLQSIQATESMSGSSNGSERQKTPPLAET